MANKDQPSGFKPWGRVLKSTPYSAGGTIYPGDLCKLKNDGTVVVVTAGDATIGAALNYAVSGGEVLVADDPNQEFVAQGDGSDIDAATDFNMNCNVLATAGNATYKQSRMEIDSSEIATNSNYPLKLMRLQGRVDNALGANASVIVRINNHQLAGGTGTVGV